MSTTIEDLDLKRYGRLLARAVPKVIKTETENERALAIVESLMEKGEENVTPDKLYTAKPTQRFMAHCSRRRLTWAIFSDHYGVWFADELHEWYGDDVGDPNRVPEVCAASESSRR